MIELLDAIHTRFTAQSLGSSITGGLWTDQAKDANARPYCIVSYVAQGQTAIAYDTRKTFEPIIQFTIIADELRAGGVLANSLTAAFDDHQPALATRFCTAMKRLQEPFFMLQPAGDMTKRDESASRIYGWYVQYQYTIQ